MVSWAKLVQLTLSCNSKLSVFRRLLPSAGRGPWPTGKAACVSLAPFQERIWFTTLIRKMRRTLARPLLLLTQLFSFRENLVPIADELAVFQQQRAAEPSPSAQTPRIWKLVNAGSEWGQGIALQRLELTFVSWRKQFQDPGFGGFDGYNC